MVLSFGGTGYRIQRFQWLGICIIIFVLMPPINLTPRLYLMVMWIGTLGHVGGGNRCGGDTVLRVMTRALVYPSQGGRYHAEGSWHWCSDSSVINDPHGAPWTVTMFFPHFLGGLLNWGL